GLWAGVEGGRLARRRPKGAPLGLPKERFGGRSADDASLVAAADGVVEVRLPAALFAGRDFVVEGRLDGPLGDRVVQFRALTAPPGTAPDGPGPVAASPDSPAYRRLL